MADLVRIGSMVNSQRNALLFLAAAVILFFFSLALLPAVEQYCRFQRAAMVLLVLQMILLGVRLRGAGVNSDRALVIGTFIFVALGIVFNALLLVSARGKC